MTGRIETSVDIERDLTIFTARGDITPEQLVLVIQEFHTGNPTSHVLWDLTAATFSNLSGADPQILAGVSQQQSKVRGPGSKTALLFDSDIGYGLGRMFESFRQVQDSHVTYNTFRSREKALVWLEAGSTD